MWDVKGVIFSLMLPFGNELVFIFIYQCYFLLFYNFLKIKLEGSGWFFQLVSDFDLEHCLCLLGQVHMTHL